MSKCVAETTYFVHIFHVNVVPFVIIIHGSGVLQYRGGSANLLKNSSNRDNLMGISCFCSQCFSESLAPNSRLRISLLLLLVYGCQTS